MILVDDGSNDGSELLINKIKDERVIVLGMILIRV